MIFAKTLLLLSVGSNITATVIYLFAIFKNKVKPHSFTFLIWSLILGINFLAQIFVGVGLSSILLATNFLSCIVIFLACIRKGYAEYDDKDIACLALGVVAIILWLITKNPLFSVALSCLIDLFAFIPSFRKSFFRPTEDSALTYYVSGLEYVFSFPSYQVFSVIGLMFPVWITLIDFCYATFILIRKKQLKMTA